MDNRNSHIDTDDPLLNRINCILFVLKAIAEAKKILEQAKQQRGLGLRERNAE